MGTIGANYDIIISGLKRLGFLLGHSRPEVAVVSPLKNVLKGEEEKPITDIEVVNHSGQEAMALAIECYQDLHIRSEWSQKSARRTIGAIWLSPARNPEAQEIIALVDQINTAKKAIKDLVTALPNRNQRFTALRDECPGVMTVHLYRQIRLLPDKEKQDRGPVTSIQFTWQQKASLFNPSKDQLEKIEERIKQEIDRPGRPETKLPLQQLLQRLQATPLHQLRVRRPVKVQPAANVWQEVDKPTTVTAPMPLLVVQDDPVKISQPKSFHADRKRESRTDKAEAVTLGTFGGVTLEAFTNAKQDKQEG